MEPEVGRVRAPEPMAKAEVAGGTEYLHSRGHGEKTGRSLRLYELLCLLVVDDRGQIRRAAVVG